MKSIHYTNIHHGFWEDINNQRKYFDWFEKKMNFKDKSDWYSITIKEIKVMVDLDYFVNIIIHYNVHLNQFIQIMNGFLGNFQRTSKNFWLNMNNQRKYFDWFEKKMNFKDKSDWYSITTREKYRNHGGIWII